jgi:hypothetical protein
MNPRIPPNWQRPMTLSKQTTVTNHCDQVNISQQCRSTARWPRSSLATVSTAGEGRLKRGPLPAVGHDSFEVGGLGIVLGSAPILVRGSRSVRL